MRAGSPPAWREQQLLLALADEETEIWVIQLSGSSKHQ